MGDAIGAAIVYSLSKKELEEMDKIDQAERLAANGTDVAVHENVKQNNGYEMNDVVGGGDSSSDDDGVSGAGA